VQTFLGLGRRPNSPPESINAADAAGSPNRESHFSSDRTISPKDFLRDKLPVTDVERVACLAYYLANYRDTPHFKTIDISAINTEAAQPKFSNASVAVDNARQAGLLVAATKGNKQLSAAGDKFVDLLPDRNAAREALRTFRPRKNSRRTKTPKAKS
jgi:hypothetical protein